MQFLIVVKEGNGEDSAEYAKAEHEGERFEYPARIDEFDHLMWFRGAVAAVGIEAGLEAGCFGFGHGATVMCLASHAG